ncbi:hypothetical protein BYT27DRAFT_7219891 [Phlegmacium glaucopus]|nr:hypothetical protein BYT27DRAFT_7219891 [Phlegmacium glaucopus]
MENPWYGLWMLELLKVTESFNNIVVVPQYALWFTLPADEPEVEAMEEIDEDAVSEDEGSAQEEGSDQDAGSDWDEGEPYSSDDELDCFRDTDESVDALKHETPNIVLDTEQDPDTSIAESLFTVPDGSAPQAIPDFVALHILTKKLVLPSSAHLRSRYERRAGYRIIHECCPLVVEIKAFPARKLKEVKLKKMLTTRLANAVQDLGFQSVGDCMDTKAWDDLFFPAAVILGTPASDLRMQEIADFLHSKPA